MLRRPELTFPTEVADFVRAEFHKASAILEYGTGGSTVLAAEMPNKKIWSVESDPQWLCNLNTYLQTRDVPSVPITIYANVGKTRKYGQPVDDECWSSFPEYALRVWSLIRQAESLPDLILVDGRFRVACFLASYIYGKEGSMILFDDYAERKSYHVVEEVGAPIRMVDRMAVFEVRGAVRANDLLDYIGYFYDPR